MQYQIVNVHTALFITLFLVITIYFLIKHTVKNHIDLYDFIVLSSVAFIPSLFVYFPRLSKVVSVVFGVEFPFLVMFGFLFIVVFLYFYHLVIRTKKLEKSLVKTIQELSLLKDELQKCKLKQG